MIQEINTAQSRINICTVFPLINAVLLNSQQGDVYEFINCNNAYYIFHKAGFSYLNSKSDIDYLEFVNFLMVSEKMPPYFHIYDAPSQIISLLEEKKDRISIRVRKRFQLKFKGKTIKDYRNSLPANFRICRIDEKIFDMLSIFKLQLENRLWNNKEDFLKNGFGFCILNEVNSPVALCYSACVADNTAEIDVMTLVEYQKKGLAKIVVNEFVNYCVDNNLIANWDCFEENESSVRTAHSIGFENIFAYNLLSIFNKEKQNERN
jgi:GNAT acetyltransferase